MAIDVAKESNVVLLRDTGGKRRIFKLLNQAADHDRFITFLQTLPGPIRVALEPTGDYHRPLAWRLLQAGCEVVSISSVALARFREARFGTWDKNDPKDAQVILAKLEQGMAQHYYDPLARGTHDWQELSGTYFQITLARTRLQHSLLLHYLPLYWPEFARDWHSTRSAWFNRFLQHFPTPAAVRLLPLDEFVTARPGTWSDGRCASVPSWKRSMGWRRPPSACRSHSTRRPSSRFGYSWPATRS